MHYNATQVEQTVELTLYNINYPHAFRWHGSVVTRVSFEVLGLTLWATLITVLHK